MSEKEKPTRLRATTRNRLIGECADAMRDELENILSGCQERGDYRLYTHITGIDPINEGLVEEQDEITQEFYINGDKPLLAQERKPAKLDLSPTSSHESRKKRLEESVEQEIIIPNLERQGPAEMSKYYDTIIVFKEPDQDADQAEPGLKQFSPGEMDEVILRRKNAEHKIRPTIDQCVDALLRDLPKKDPDHARGARLRFTYFIDDKGRLSMGAAEREYLNYDLKHELTIPIPETRLEGTDRKKIGDLEYTARCKARLEPYLRKLLPEIIENKIVQSNLKRTGHPEYQKFFMRDMQGKLIGITPEGRKRFSRFVDAATRQLVPELLRMQSITKGGLVSLETEITDFGLKDMKLDHITLDPEKTIFLRERLPDTGGCGPEQRELKYKSEADGLAIDVIAANMKAAGHPHFKRYFERMDHESEQQGRDVYTFTEEGEEHLARLYEEIAESISGAMNALDQEKPAPFFLNLGVERKQENGGVQEPLVLEYKEVFTQPEERRLPPIIIDAQPAHEGKVTDDYIECLAREVFDKVVTYAVAPQMIASRHPEFTECFTPDPKRKGAHILTEKGAEKLDDLIRHLTTTVARQTLRHRAIMQEPLAGHRTRCKYIMNYNDTLAALMPINEYFAPQKNTTTFRVPNNEARLSKMDEQKRKETLRNHYKNVVGKDLVTRMMAGNMKATNHPAFREYFIMTKEDPYPRLTETGLNVLGSQVDRWSEKIADQMMQLPEGDKGGIYRINYSLKPGKVEYAVVQKVASQEDPRLKALRQGVIIGGQKKPKQQN